MLVFSGFVVLLAFFSICLSHCCCGRRGRLPIVALTFLDGVWSREAFSL